jgi:hypothetical protein
MKHITLKKAILSALILFGTVIIAQGESFKERTENWTKRSATTQSGESYTPPSEPNWEDAPIGDGVWFLLIAAGIYGICIASAKNIKPSQILK